MSANAQLHEDRLPQWLWLWLPVASFAVLLICGQVLSPDIYELWIGNERTGILENLHAIIPFVSFLLALQLLFHRNLRSFSWLWGWLLLAALGSFYMGGEEASWGQHWFQWITPENWTAVNDQGETNLHNTSSWLDQKPRTLMEIGIIIGGIILPLLALRRPQILRHRFAVVIPPLSLLPCALLAEIARMTERLLSALDWPFTLFQRASEVQELFFALFVLFYLLVLRKRLNGSPEQLPT